MRQRLVKIFMASTAILFGIGSVSALAASPSVANSNLTVRLNIVDGCSVNFDQGNDINIGSYSNLNTPLLRASSFSVRCSASGESTANLSYSVSLDSGVNAERPGDVNSRRMKGLSQGQYIHYEVHKGAAPGQVWGKGSDAILGTRASAGANTVNRHDFVVMVPASDITPAIDEYMDTLTATLVYNMP